MKQTGEEMTLGGFVLRMRRSFVIVRGGGWTTSRQVGTRAIFHSCYCYPRTNTTPVVTGV